MSAWGRTGRVVLESGATQGVYNDVHIDGMKVGIADDLRGRWRALVFTGKYTSIETSLPSLDAAVMWVLRRAAPDVWREERGGVWRVVRCESASLGFGWDAYLPGEDKFGHYDTHADAMKAAAS